MFKPSEIIIKQYLAHTRDAFQRAHPGVGRDYVDVLERAGRMSLHHVARSNAVYTNLESTLLVAEVALRILEGVVPGDTGRKLIISPDGETLELERGQTDGVLLRDYIERSQMFIRERLGATELIDAERLAEVIELTRMPTPRTAPEDQESWPALLRAAQTIALGADPRFVQRSKKLYRQLEEAGFASKMGYKNPADVIDTYPQRFWKHLLPQITVALSYLKYTGGGQIWLARLNSRMLEEEHKKEA